MTNNFVSLNELIQRDLNPNSEGGKYQIQAEENCSNAKFISLEKKFPDICIFEYDIDDFKCSLIQYTLSDDDINKRRFNMIGFLIKNKKEMVIGALDLIFDFDKDVKIDYLLDGKFKVVLTNQRGEKKIIKNMDSYIGNANAVHLMAELLGDCLGEIVEGI